MSRTPEEIERMVEETYRKIKYEVYMQSPRWAKTRKAKLIEADWTCAKCGYNRLTSPLDIPLDVHHMTYEHFTEEEAADLQVLCRPCHMRIHGH